MDINDLRSIGTVLAFATFIGIVLWAYSGRRRTDFDEAARLPFTEDDSLFSSPCPRTEGRSAARASQANGLQGKTS